MTPFKASSDTAPQEDKRFQTLRESVMVPTPLVITWEAGDVKNKPSRKELAGVARYNIRQALWFAEGDANGAKEALYRLFPTLKTTNPDDIPTDAVLPDDRYALIVEIAREMKNMLN